MGEQNAVALLQILAMYAYYPMEHLYWLDAKKVITLPNTLGARLSQWSCQAWLFSLLLDIYILGWQALRKYEKHQKLQKPIGSASLERIAEVNEVRLKESKELKQELTKLGLKMIVALGDLPLAWAWSWEDSNLSPFLIGLFGSISSAVGLYLKFDP